MILSGTLKKIIFRNEENGWTVGSLRTDEGDTVSFVCTLPPCAVGEKLSLEGKYVKHPRYGLQFKAVSCTVHSPSDLSAIEKFLSSGLIRGIGAPTARQIVEFFGEDALDVMDNQPEQLLRIPGIGKKKLAMIMESYRANSFMRTISMKLDRYGISTGQAQKLLEIYGDDCITRIEEDPYQMIEDVEGIGFITADRIAMEMDGYNAESPRRLCALLCYLIENAVAEAGHTYLTRKELLEKAYSSVKINPDLIEDALDELISRKKLSYRMVGEEDSIFDPRLLFMENEIAARLCKMNHKPSDNLLLLSAGFPVVHSVKLASEQRNAVEKALSEGLLIITGGPGTGKTTIIRYVCDILSHLETPFLLTAPTGRAAKRMTEATGYEAKTIHRLLEYIPGEGFQRHEEAPLECEVIIVDEVSMVDVPLMWHLLRAIPDGARLILVGDADQLPPVGPGDVLRDMILSNVIPVIRLEEVFRQKEESRIVENAHLVNTGNMPLLDGNHSDFIFESIHSQEEIVHRLTSLYADRNEILETSEPLMDIQVLTPMKQGTLGVYNLNRILQAAINPPSPGKTEHVAGEKTFRIGDKVMQIKNDYRAEWTKRGYRLSTIDGSGIFNGDMGTILRIEPEEHRLAVVFDDDRLAWFDFSHLDEIELAYCISIHKSQGSEFPVVILPVCSGPSILLSRNLLYTAITRGKRQVIMLGSENTISRMVQNDRSGMRHTALREMLQEWSSLV